VHTGRIPVSLSQQATDVVDKILEIIIIRIHLEIGEIQLRFGR